jgi:hypothetical protein
MSELVMLFDALITVAAGGSAWLWWAAGRHQVRRVRGDELLNPSSLNRRGN